jgi:hypothetical protein
MGGQAARRSAGARQLVLKTYAAWMPGRGELLAVFHQQAAAHRERLARYEANQRSLETRFGGTPPVTEPEFGSYATLRCGLSYERHRIGWCEWTIEQLNSPE